MKPGLMRSCGALIWAVPLAVGSAFAQIDEAKVTAPVHLISAEGVGDEIGTLTITQEGDHLVFTAELEGLEPGPHAFHVHENPDCGPAERDGQMVAGLAAGGHLGADGMAHGHSHSDDSGSAMSMDMPMGDLPELVVPEGGGAIAPVSTMALTSIDMVRGRSVMIHADGQAANSGGARIACAVIPAS